MSKRNIVIILAVIFIVGILLANRWMQSQLSAVESVDRTINVSTEKVPRVTAVDESEAKNPELRVSHPEDYGIVMRNDDFTIGQSQWSNEMEKTLKKTLESNPLTSPVGQEKKQRSAADIQKQIDKIALQIQAIEKKAIVRNLDEQTQRQLTNLYTLKAALEAVKN